MGRSSSTGRLRGGRVRPGGRGAPCPGGGTGEPTGGGPPEPSRAAGLSGPPPVGGGPPVTGGGAPGTSPAPDAAGARAAGGGPPGPAVAPAFGGGAAAACVGLPAGGCALPGGAPGGAFRCGGWGARGWRSDGVAGVGVPCSSTLVTPWSSSRRYLRIRRRSSGRGEVAETLRRSGCRGRAAAALHDEAGSSVLRVIAGSDGHPHGRVHPMSRPQPPGAHRPGACPRLPAASDTARAARDFSCRRDPGR